MTYFENDNGDRIEISDDFSLTKSAVNLFDFTLKGNSSTTFQVPNNSQFKSAFGYYSPLQNPSSGFISQYFNLVKNGTVIDRGKLILEREDRDNLYFFFASGNSNWLVNIPDISIRDIDYDDFAITDEIDNPNTYAAATSGFCYPLLDWGMDGNILGNIYWYRLASDSSNNFEQACINSFYPCFFLKSAMDQIFTYCQLKIGGDILNDPVYQQMIITPDNGQITRADKFFTDRRAVISNSSNVNFNTKITFDIEIENGALSCWDSINSKYIANKSCLLVVKPNINLNVSCYSQLDIYKNGSLFLSYKPQIITGTVLYIASANSSVLTITNEGTLQNIGNAGTLRAKEPILLAASTGDYYEFRVNLAGTNQGSWNPASNPFGGQPTTSAVADYWTISNNGTVGGRSVVVGDIIQSTKINGTGTDFLILHSTLQLLANSILEIAPRQNLNMHWSINDTLRASDILPDMKMIDLIKFVSQYFCAPPTFDIPTQTVYFNKLDNFDYTKALDWSQYLQKWENNYSIQTALYNYIRFTQPDDGNLKALGSGKDLKYGDVLIQGQSSTKITNEIYQLPFSPAIDRISRNSLLCPFISLYDIEFDGDPLQITSVTNSVGNPLIHLASSPQSDNILIQQLILIYGTQYYDGYMPLSESAPTTTPLLFDIPFAGTSTGYIQKLKVNFKSGQSRILFFTGSQGISSISTLSNIYVDNSGTALSNIGYAYFSKPTNNYSISSFKQGLNLDYYIGGYDDIPRRLDYYKNLTRILNAPYEKIWLYLPELVFAAFNMDKFVFIMNKDQQKYYYVDSIENYKDSKTLVQVNMLLLL